ncbi:MAG: hypothetical protein FWC68_06140 [Oscillospiraceae bacterium]|nr:hypothetical protein [Oscillospiraceae bacterium]
MVLKSILNGIEGLKAKGNLDIEIKGITYDSREVKEGYLFIAIKGFELDRTYVHKRGGRKWRCGRYVRRDCKQKKDRC